MRWEIKRFERGKTGEDIRRERGEMDGSKTSRRKQIEKTKKWTQEVFQEMSRK